MRRRGIDPKPLGSQEFLKGQPNLSGVNKERVELAIELYKFTARAAAELQPTGISWSIVNPTNNLMWATNWFKELERLCADATEAYHHSLVSFAMFMHGARGQIKLDFSIEA